MRAVHAGFRNVLCDDTFVAHTGSRSFDSKKRALMEANTRRLVAKHPSYPERVHRFIAADPLLPLRKLAETALRRLQAPGLSGILHILHSRQGGTENHIRDLMRAETQHYLHYLLIVQGDRWLLEDGNGATWLTYALKRGADEPWSVLLNSLCSTLGISLCHVHHISGARDGLLLGLADLCVPYGITLHDSYLACPTVTLLAPDGDYCGAVTDPAACQRCLDAQVLYRGIPIADWRAAHQKLLAQAVFLLAPSVSVAETLQRYYPQSRARIIPHGTATEALSHDDPEQMCSVLLLPHDQRHIIGVLGAIGPVKGARRLERLVARTKARQLPLRWVVIGYTDHQYQAWQDKDKTLTIHGAYRSGELAALIDHYRVRLTVFPAAGPESFSYTLSESWALGCPALVPPIGALHERVVASGAGWIMGDWQNEDRILDQILGICAQENATEFKRRATLAATTALPSLAEMAEATVAVYAECMARLDSRAAAYPPPLPTERLLNTAAEPNNTRAPVPRDGESHALLRQLLHLALRARYTSIGHWLYRRVPVHWQQRFKAYLMD
jgi:glycosyltransferase involved in cell wall biosynthesis